MSSNVPNGGKDGETDVIIGRVVSVNVPKRQLRIASETSYPERFEQMRELRLETEAGTEVLVPLDGIRVTQKAVIASARSESDEEIASLRGANVVVKRSKRHPLPDGENYADDLVGLTVKDASGNVIGKLCEVWETPANDVYQVLDDGGREILLPAIEDVILEVDIEGGVMVADISTLI